MMRLFFSALLACIPLGMQAGEWNDIAQPAGWTSVRWDDLSSSTHPGSVTDTGPWKSDIPAGSGFSLAKASGSAYATPNGLYSGNASYHGPLAQRIMAGKITDSDLPNLKAGDFANTGLLRISGTTPGTRSVILYVRIHGISPTPPHTAFALTQHVFPARLTCPETGQHWPPTSGEFLSAARHNGLPGEIYALRWDLPQAVKDFTVTWNVYPHSCTSGLRLDCAPPGDG